MSSIKSSLFLIVVMVAINACKWDKKQVESSPEGVAPINIVMDSIYKSGPEVIANGDTSSSYVLIKYPSTLGIGAADQLIIKTIKDMQIEDFHSVLDPEGNTTKIDNVNDAIDRFIKSSETDAKERDNTFMGYFFESYADTNFVGNEVISMLISNFSFTGGAHPNTYTTFLNFERSSGKLIDMNAIIQDTNAMKVVVKKAFDENEKKEMGADYDEKSYFFDGGFALPQNYSITGKGLLCLYNPYEAAAYARGPISFTIPWKDLHGIITKYVPLDDVKLGDDLQ